MNSITLCGNLTRDPEMRQTSTGKPMVVFGVADSRGRDKTIFFDCTAFDDVAQRIMRYFTKGKPIFLSGTLDTREYTNRDGLLKTALSVTVTSWDFVSVGGNRPNGEGGGNAPRPQNSGQRSNNDYNEADAPPDMSVPDISDPFADQ